MPMRQKWIDIASN